MRLLRRTCLLLMLLPSIVQADVDFYRDVYPILKANCIACHNKKTTESSLNLEVPEFIRTGGDSGPGVVMGQAAESLMYLASKQEGDIVMPPEKNSVGARKLTGEELKILADWINAGAKDSIREVQKVFWRPLPAGLHPIYSVDVSRNGRWGACGRGNQVAIYDLATRQFSSLLIDDSLSDQNSSQQSRSHQGFVQAVAFNPDGTRLASGSFREVKIWHQDRQAVTQLKELSVPDLVEHALTLDGKLHVVIDAHGTLHAVDVSTGKTVKTIPNVTTATAAALAVSPDGESVAIISSSDTVGVWSLSSGVRTTLITSPSPTQAIAWTMNGTSLAVAGEDNIIRHWTLPLAPAMELAPPQEFPAAPANVDSLLALTNPDRLLIGCQNGQIQIRSLVDGKQTASFKIPGGVTFADSPDSRLVAVGCTDGVVRVWDVPAHKLLVELKEDLETRNRLAAINWQLAAGTLELKYLKQEDTRLTAANKSLDEALKQANETIAAVNKIFPNRQKSLANANTAQEAAQGEVNQITEMIAKLAEGMKDAELDKQLQTGQQRLMKAAEQESTALMELRTSENHLNDAMNEVAVITAAQQRNSELLMSANEAITIATQEIQQAKAELAELQKTQQSRKQRPVAVAFSADSQTIAAVYDNGEQRVWAVASSTPIVYVAGDQKTASAMIASPGAGQFVTSLNGGRTTLLQTDGSWVLERILGGEANPTAFSDRVNAVQFSPDGKILAVGGGEPSRSGEISLWDIASGNLITAWNDRHTDSVLSLEFSPDGTLLASGGADKLVKVTEIATGEVKHLFEGHTHHALGVAFRGDGRILASAGGDGAVLTWDMQTGERNKKITGWNKEVTSAQFLGATNSLVTSAGDNQVRLVDDQGTQIRSISNIPEFLHSVASPADGSLIMAGGEDGILHLWRADNGHELVAFPPH